MALANFDLTGDFGDAKAEAEACRTDCALFDFSFLECARLTGENAKEIIAAFAGRSLDNLSVGKIHYALRVDRAGNAVADLTIWRTAPAVYEVMSGRREDVADLLSHAGVEFADVTPRVATFALQGPRSLEVLRAVGDVRAIQPLDYFGFAETMLDGIRCRIGRLGYTGEAGFEIIAPRSAAHSLWQALSRHARPAGFIAADMLRIEAGFVLFSNEFRLPVSPAEAGLGKFHHRSRQAASPLALAAFRAEADIAQWPWTPAHGLLRPGAPGEIAVTSACDSNAAGGILGLGYVLAGGAGTRLHDPTGIFRNIRRVPLPYYDRAKRRPRAPWPAI